MTDYVREREAEAGGEGGGRGFLSYFYDKGGGGWLGYRGLFAVLLSNPQLGLFAYWITYTSVTLSSGMFYLTLLPVLIAILLIALLPGKSGITPKRLATFAVMALIPYTLYDWARVPINLAVGVPFWDHWFDWGASILGSTGTLFTYENLTAGLAAHILRGWGFAMAYYILVRRVTLLSAFAFAWAMTVIYWVVLPIWVLTDALPPGICWFTAWVSHMVFALGLWVAPKIFQRLYKRPSEMSAVGSKGSKETSNYQRSWKTTLPFLPARDSDSCLGLLSLAMSSPVSRLQYTLSLDMESHHPSLSKGLVPTIGQL